MLSKKVVQVNDTEFLKFILPDYEVKYNISSLDFGKKIIFTGFMNERNKRKLYMIPSDYVMTQGQPDVDLSSRRGLLNFVFAKYNRTVPKYFDEMEDLYDPEFMYCIKIG